jgi:uncharacterized membrane protein YeaQ/YmgE (transglycosylase-associated protein family)
MGLLAWIILGIVAGWLACRLTRRDQPKDYLLNIVVGVIGACAGGFITNLVIFSPVFDFNLQSLLVAGLASFVFLVVANAVRR